ncbi:MAG: hypothetical protein HY481_00640 [Candidatus Vogelbacteria bacterium]|nr:hypothetical protein [Candidatus Vogelbacteria bacterium]
MVLQLAQFLNESFFRLIRTALETAPFWLPVVLVYWFWHLWRYYTRSKYNKNTPWVLLEIKIPREITKSPKAMEVVNGIFFQTYDGNQLDKIFRGFVRAWFSLELVSVGGEVHFYIRTPKFHKNLVEAQIYSQYPEVEIYEAEDYVNNIPPYGAPGSDWLMWGTEFKLSKDDAYPIKTYVDYGLDDNPKEEHKIDPLTPVLEFLGSIGPSEQIWIQILVMSTMKRFKKPGAWFKKQDWRGDSEALVEKLMKRDKPLEAGKFPPRLSPGEEEVVKAVERSVSKIGFDCGMRGIYLAKQGSYDASRVVGLINSVRQYSSLHLNGFSTFNRTTIDYPWQDFRGLRIEWLKRRLFDAYRRRSWFHPPHKRRPFVLNGEELATIYHFPGQVATTPTLKKIESKKGEPPVDLPI